MRFALLALSALLALGMLRVFWGMIRASAPAFRALLARRTLRVGELRGGEVEVAGRLFAGLPLRSASGRRCAAVQVEIHSEWAVAVGGQSKGMDWTREALFLAPELTLRDRSGRCRLAVSPGEMVLSVNPVRRVYGPEEVDRLLARCPHYRPLVHPGARVTLVERSVRSGARVLATGLASADEQAEPEGYREGVGARFKLGPSPGEKLLLSPGSQGQALARLAGPLVMGLGVLGVVGSLAWAAFQLAWRI